MIVSAHGFSFDVLPGRPFVLVSGASADCDCPVCGVFGPLSADFVAEYVQRFLRACKYGCEVANQQRCAREGGCVCPARLPPGRVVSGVVADMAIL